MAVPFHELSGLARRAASESARSSIARTISALRSFFRWLERRDLAHNATFKSIRSPKVPRRLPKPLSPKEALQIIEGTDALGGDPWLATRDAALYTMLYASGLRIGEALGLNRKQAPERDSMVITGKGNKQRMVPVLAIVPKKIQAYLAACPYELWPDAPDHPVFD